MAAARAISRASPFSVRRSRSKATHSAGICKVPPARAARRVSGLDVMFFMQCASHDEAVSAVAVFFAFPDGYAVFDGFDGMARSGKRFRTMLSPRHHQH